MKNSQRLQNPCTRNQLLWGKLTPLITNICSQHSPAIIGELAVGNCSISISSNPRREAVHLNLDMLARRFGHHGDVADLASVLDGPRVDLIIYEYKASSKDAKKIESQLTGGSSLCDQLLNGERVSDFKAVYVYAKRPHTAALKTIARKKIGFRNMTVPIIPLQCGKRIAAGVNRSGALSIQVT